MKGFFALLLLAAAGYAAWHFWAPKGPSFGVDSFHSVGTFEEVDAHLAQAGMTRGSGDPYELEELLGRAVTQPGSTVVTYRDPQSRDDMIALVRTDNGQILSLAGRIAKGSGDFRAQGGGTTERFLSDYWIAIVGAPPTFETADEDEERRATGTVERASCRWTKTSPTGRFGPSVVCSEVATFRPEKAMLRR